MTATCETCRWWEPEPGQNGNPEETGICRRYAPRPHVYEEHGCDPAFPIWPRTLHDEWCGEHQPKEPTP